MRLAEGLKTVVNADGGIALDTRRGLMVRLNPTGALILELLAVDSTEDQITIEIARRCHTDVNQVAADVHAFLLSLSDRGLITREAQS